MIDLAALWQRADFLSVLDCRGRWRDLHGTTFGHTALSPGVLPLLRLLVSIGLRGTTHGRYVNEQGIKYKRQLPAAPVATPVLHAYVMPDRDLGFVFPNIRREHTRAFAVYMRRCSSLLTCLLVVTIPEFHLVFFLRLSACITLWWELGGPVLAPVGDFVALVCRDAFASSTKRCESCAVGRRNFATQMTQKGAEGRNTSDDDTEVDLHD